MGRQAENVSNLTVKDKTDGVFLLPLGRDWSSHIYESPLPAFKFMAAFWEFWSTSGTSHWLSWMEQRICFIVLLFELEVRIIPSALISASVSSSMKSGNDFNHTQKCEGSTGLCKWKCLLQHGTLPCVSRGTNNRVAMIVVIVTVSFLLWSRTAVAYPIQLLGLVPPHIKAKK